MKNVITIGHLYMIGGVEEFIYQLAKNYERDLTVFYKSADPFQVKRLEQYCEAVQWNGKDRIVCDRAFFQYDIDKWIDYVDANEYYEIIHGDYKAMNIPAHLDKRVNKYLCVSNHVMKTFLEVSGIDPGMCEVCYNPIEISEEERKPSVLIGSFTRLSKEKGGERIKALAEALNKANVSYLWLIFSDYSDFIKNENVIFIPKRLDKITNLMLSMDFIAQLSDCEGWPYTPNQAKNLGVPMIYTPFEAMLEMGVDENDIRLEMDLSNIDEVVERIKNYPKKTNHPKTTFKPKHSNWDKWLLKGKRRKGTKMKIKALKDYFDTYEHKDISLGQIYDTTQARGEYIVSKGYAEVVVEPKENKDEPKKRRKNAVSKAAD